MPVRPRFPALAVVVILLGACASPAVAPTATQAPTEEPTAEPTPSAEPSAEASQASADPSATELDPQLASNFGSTDLEAGFTPDPFSEDLVSGGPVDVSYLGDECRGFATAASDYDVTYESGAADLLRFYFVADTADTTLIVNAPDGSWHCNDDAPGTIDPMIDFSNPESGRYDIWVGSFEEGSENAGTLYVTELDSNSP